MVTGHKIGLEMVKSKTPEHVWKQTHFAVAICRSDWSAYLFSFGEL
jgi:hypothetical protein